jgi:hypothetical protein
LLPLQREHFPKAKRKIDSGWVGTSLIDWPVEFGAGWKKAIQSLRLRLHSGLRQSGTHSSHKKPRDEWGTLLPIPLTTQTVLRESRQEDIALEIV